MSSVQGRIPVLSPETYGGVHHAGRKEGWRTEARRRELRMSQGLKAGLVSQEP